MDTVEDAPDSEDIGLLVASLNDLLVKLHIPFPLETPLDLTPSLLLAILESILRSRLPISDSIRTSQDPQSKVQAMKIFIGVLENDIIGQDVGLSEVDPRKVAEGEWDEVVFIGELLVWLGKSRGYLPLKAPQESSSPSNEPVAGSSKSSGVRHAEVRATTPSPMSQSTITTRNSLDTTLSMVHTAPHDSDTSVLSPRVGSPALSDLDLFDASESSRDLAGTPTPLPRRQASIHEPEPEPEPELEGPSFSNIGHSTLTRDREPTGPSTPSQGREPMLYPKKRVPIRYTGWIERVDDDLEIQKFESRRRTSSPRTPSNHDRPNHESYPSTPKTPPSAFPEPVSTSTPRRPSSRPRPKPGIITRHTSPTQYHLALLNERARLMAELANIKSSRPR